MIRILAVAIASYHNPLQPRVRFGVAVLRFRFGTRHGMEIVVFWRYHGSARAAFVRPLRGGPAGTMPHAQRCALSLADLPLTREIVSP